MRNHILIIAIGISFLLAFYGAVAYPLLRPILALPPLPGGIFGQTLSTLLFVLVHSIYALGLRHAVAFFGASAAITWTLEEAGVAGGWIYGGYHYTEVLGVQLGHVPILIPLSWFIYLYPSYIIVNCMIGDPPVGTHGSLWRAMWISALGGIVVTAQDLIFDPLLSGPGIQAWVWEQGGGYFGVPTQNFLGWIITGFIVFALYRAFERKLAPTPIGAMTPTITTLPIIVYGFLLVTSLLDIGIAELRVVGPFVLGIPMLIALTHVWLPREGRTISAH